MAAMDDDEEPSNLALFWEGEVLEDTNVSVTVSSGGAQFMIPPQFLQWGYKLYGEGYNLISEVDDSCLA